jgi:hypothetical protein
VSTNSFKLLNIIRNLYYLLFIFLPQEFKRFISKTEHELNRLIKLSEKTASINLTRSTDKKILSQNVLKYLEISQHTLPECC